MARLELAGMVQLLLLRAARVGQLALQQLAVVHCRGLLLVDVAACCDSRVVVPQQLLVVVTATPERLLLAALLMMLRLLLLAALSCAPLSQSAGQRCSDSCWSAAADSQQCLQRVCVPVFRYLCNHCM
jgi:hypothetical protein